jgi:lipopolysaccharide assembly outer membrane protein LptD (OstA)
MSVFRPRQTLIIMISLAAAIGAHAQTGDTTSASLITVMQDTTIQDTARPASPTGVDTLVMYTARDSVVYSLSSKTMYLHGEGEIRYRELGLKAENIDIDWTTATLTARGVPDSTDTTGHGYRGLPDLTDRGEVYKGRTVTYNFKSKRGKIGLAETEIDDAFYYGENIKKVDDDVLFVGGGVYTTCDLPHPHYYFGSPEMKVVVKDEIVARPVVMYVSDVPVMALPFGVFPNKSGRRSGLVVPTFGLSSDRGRYLQHLGYYWAMSDYTDWSLTGDGYTNGSWVLYSNFRYAARYDFSGTLNASYGRTFSGERGDPNYASEDIFNIRLGHHQDFDPTARLDVDVTFTSDSYYQNTSFNYDDLLRQQIISNATFQKSWEGTPNSMTINLNRTQDLQTGNLTAILPNIVFNRAQSYPFRSGAATGAAKTWYERIGYGYTGQFRNEASKTKNSLTGDFTNEDGRGIQHSVPVNMSANLGYFNVTPFFNYTEKWYDRSIMKSVDSTDNSAVTTEDRGFHAVRTFDTGISLGTKLYGVIQPGVLGITGVRHQLTPSISYTYAPDFSEPQYGYWGSYKDTSGNEIRYSFYEKEVFGGAPSGERQAITVRLGNVFEMKTVSGDTSGGGENKFQLLNMDISGGYNFARDSLKFDEISLGYRTAIGDLLNIGGASRFNLYKFDPVVKRRVDRFLLDEEGRLAQMTSFNVSISTKLRGEKEETKAGPKKETADSLAQGQETGYIGLYKEPEPDFSIPWQLDLTWNFSQNQSNPDIVTRSSNISASLGFNLTQFWKFQATASYDLINREFAAPQINIYRDLHCWEMSFNWVPLGVAKHYALEIRLKSPLLQDVKVTKRASTSGIY